MSTHEELRHTLIEAAGALVENYPARMLALDLSDALRRAEQLGGLGEIVGYHVRDAARKFLHYAPPLESGPEEVRS